MGKVLIFMIILFQFSCPFYCADRNGHLNLHKLSLNRIEGTYYSKSMMSGIRFSSSTDSLSITSLGGDPLLMASTPVGPYRWIVIDGKFFVQVKFNQRMYTDYALPDFYRTLSHLKQESIAHLLSMAMGKNVSYHQKALQQSLSSLLVKPGVDLILAASFAMGSETGITGNIYPAILPFHLASLQLHKLLQLTNTTHKPTSQHRMGVGLTQGISDDSDCLEECPPCPDDLCLGMCGYSCHCWSWVCGDCCYHLGCYGHDVCCREKFVQTKCLLPFSFKCEDPYEC